ncbi:MAG: thymidylate kinase [Dehalococcoidia bacterium]|nr:thymidylate kinase [Dehalococcoidia bacterium]
MKRFYGSGLPGVDPADLTGPFVVIEGQDGAGRSTHVRLLRDWLEGQGHAVAIVGLRRSALIARELSNAKQGNMLGRTTMSLFYATDLADQLEHQIIPALRAGNIVLADRYIYTLMARDMVRGLDPEWVEGIYGMAPVPDAVFYIRVAPRRLVQRALAKTGVLDYWESGMDLGLSPDLFDSFVKYQTMLQRAYRELRKQYNFEIINGNRMARAVMLDMRRRMSALLEREYSERLVAAGTYGTNDVPPQTASTGNGVAAETPPT